MSKQAAKSDFYINIYYTIFKCTVQYSKKGIPTPNKKKIRAFIYSPTDVTKC